MTDVETIYVDKMGETGDIRIKAITNRNVKIDGNEIKLYLNQKQVECLAKELQKFI